MFATMPRRAALALLALTASAGLSAGCGDAPSRNDCQKLLEHLIDLEIASGGGKPEAETEEAKAQRVKFRKQIADGASEKFFEACVHKTPKAVVDCSIAAKTLEDAAKCDHAK